MILGHFIEIPTLLALGVIVGVLGGSILLSIYQSKVEQKPDTPA